MKPFLIILFVIGFISSCKDENSTESSIEEQRLADKNHNSSIIEGLGNIDVLNNYAPNQENTPIINIAINNDKLIYFGSTNQEGAPSKLNGFIWYESSTKSEFYLKIDPENHKYSMISSNIPNLLIEIALVNDSLFSVNGFKINKDLKEKTALFEFYRKSQSSLKSGEFFKSSSIEKDEIDNLVKRLDEESNNPVQILKGFYESIKNGVIKIGDNEDVITILNGISKGADFGKVFLKEIGSVIVSVPLTPISVPRFIGELNNNYTELDKYELSQIGGYQQTVRFGKTPDPLVAYLTYDGSPSGNQSIAYEVSINGDAKTFYTSSDPNGIVTIELGATKVEGEATGAKEIFVKVYKGGFINKSTTFQIQLEKRPRISLIIDNSTNNQEGLINEVLKLPLKVAVQDEIGKAVYDVDISWTDLTGLGLSSSKTYTNFEGVSSNTWKMSAKEGTHQAIANIVENNEYVIVSGMVEFSANAKKAEFEVTLYNSTNGNCDIKGQSLDYYVDGKYVLTIGAGSSATIMLSEGNHLIAAKNSNWSGYETTVIVTSDVSSNWLWAGCTDGTHPGLKSAELNNSTGYGSSVMKQ